MDDDARPSRRWLVAGSSGGERAPVDRASAPSERWFEPLHVQDPAAARERIASQVAAGADVVSAPTWRTHRRALMEVGESRRAREWTEAAVRVAREGIDAGVERRATAEAGSDADPDTDRPAARPVPQASDPPLVAGVLPSFDDAPEPGTGRLLAREPAAARDYEEAAGHLADADVDLIIVEARAGDAGLRMAVEATSRTGVAVWVAATGPLPDATDAESVLSTWAETASEAGAVGLLLADGAAGVAARIAEGVASQTWGGLVGETGDRSGERVATDTSAWLDVGATAVGLLRGARPERLAAMRSAIDGIIVRERDEARTRDARWEALVARGASMAPGGAALWLAGRPSAVPSLPPGFDWTIAAPDEVPHLPRERYRLVLAPAGRGVAPAAVAGLLDAGGILVAALESHTGPAASLEDVRLVDVDPHPQPALAIYRRES